MNVQECSEPVAVLTLRPTATRTHKRKKVLWSEDTVDNEHMNKKKSKCCCIYSKPRQFGESDSECSDDECEHCFGHVERRHTHAHHTHTQETPAEPPVAVSLPPGPGTAPPGPAPPDQAPPT